MTTQEQINELKRLIAECETFDKICDAMRDEVWDLEKELKDVQSRKECSKKD